MTEEYLSIKGDFNVLRLIARVSSSGDGGKTYELEIHRGLSFVLDAKTVERIDEFTDPMTNLPVANVYLKAGATVEGTFKAKLTQAAVIAENNGSERLPFNFGGRFPRPSATPNIQELIAALTIGGQKCCSTTNPTTGDCTEEDPLQSFTI